MKIDLEKVRIEESWKVLLADEFLSDYFLNIKANLLCALKTSEVFPPMNLLFNAFNLTPFDAVKVVILGQDPYHQKGQAMGLSFSVSRGVKLPPSLVNIFKEIEAETGEKMDFSNGDLTSWARQGVLLLNATLSVSAGAPTSHANFGWQCFTDAVIRKLNAQKENLVFMLWGNHAKSKTALLDATRHLVLTAAHPSPLARGAFFGCGHFVRCNEFLRAHGKQPIEWKNS